MIDFASEHTEETRRKMEMVCVALVISAVSVFCIDSKKGKVNVDSVVRSLDKLSSICWKSGVQSALNLVLAFGLSLLISDHTFPFLDFVF
jgi:hypothetical protein